MRNGRKRHQTWLSKSPLPLWWYMYLLMLEAKQIEMWSKFRGLCKHVFSTYMYIWPDLSFKFLPMPLPFVCFSWETLCCTNSKFKWGGRGEDCLMKAFSMCLNWTWENIGLHEWDNYPSSYWQRFYVEAVMPGIFHLNVDFIIHFSNIMGKMRVNQLNARESHPYSQKLN